MKQTSWRSHIVAASAAAAAAAAVAFVGLLVSLVVGEN